MPVMKLITWAPPQAALGLSLYSISDKRMEITAGQLKQNRLVKMQRGVIAAGRSLDNKARALWGEPEFARNGGYSRRSPYRAAMITLTYRDGVEWSPLHIAALIKHYREWFKRNAGCPFLYVWTVELQERGIPHYHIVVWIPQGVMPPLPDKQGWWPHGMSNAIFAKSPVGYIAKYASKGDGQSGHHLPPRCRLWGHGGLAIAERAEIAFANAPRWLKGVIHHEAHPVKAVYETVERVLISTVGVFQHWHEKVTRKAGWTLKAGEGAGGFFFSPFEVEGFSPSGITLTHRGVIEYLAPTGDTFMIPYGATA